ncbi:Uncharacterised protein [uncultured archaeon]|nr:Uncharacterised protein [uncultured archaeon]
MFAVLLIIEALRINEEWKLAKLKSPPPTAGCWLIERFAIIETVALNKFPIFAVEFIV